MIKEGIVGISDKGVLDPLWGASIRSRGTALEIGCLLASLLLGRLAWLVRIVGVVDGMLSLRLLSLGCILSTNLSGLVLPLSANDDG